MDIRDAGLQRGRSVELPEGLVEPAPAAIHEPQIEVTLERTLPVRLVRLGVNPRLEVSDLTIPLDESGRHAIARD